MEFWQAAVIGIIKSALDTREQEQLDISLHAEGRSSALYDDRSNEEEEQ
jgi:hypothetical protein